MAKYFYTSGKRKGKVYQEFYYTLNGQQIVNKKSFYCPVNTKWLSKEEFRNYILELIHDYYPNYLVVDELPEQLDSHVIYFLKQINEDQSVYYDIYVYDNEQLKQITLKGGDLPDLDYIIQAVDNLTSKSLKLVYKSLLPANYNVVTDNDGYVIFEPKPHLYAQSFFGQSSTYGHAAFVVYTSISTKLTNKQLGDYLYNLNFVSQGYTYPANGLMYNRSVAVTGIYAVRNGSGATPYNFVVVAVKDKSFYGVNFSQYSNNAGYRIVQIF